MVRYKARYLLFNILYPTAQQLTSSIPSSIQTSGELAVLLRETLSQQFGDWGSGIAGGLSVKYFSPTTSTGIVRVGREQYRLVWAALTFLKEIKGQPCIISVVHVSGTIKKAEIEAMKRANRAIQQVSVEQREDMMLDETMTDDNVES